MALTGSTNAEKIYNFLISAGCNAYGACGALANFYAESGNKPKNLQNSYETKLGYTDDTYTDAVDNGTYTKFSSDSAGYGLAQWTSSGRKKNMLTYHQGKGKSIGDLETQLNFFVKECKESYSAVWTTLKTATSVSAATTAVMLKYERPADQSTTAQNTRISYGEKYYKQYAGTTTTATTTESTSSSSSSSSTSSTVKAGQKLTLKSCPLYVSSTTKTKTKNITGTYYLWNAEATNDRYKITNSTANVGKAGKITGWIDASYVSTTSATTTSTTTGITAGKKLTLKNCPLYATSTTKTKSNTLTGTYYIWSATAKNSRYRITNSISNVGKAGQITGWIDASYAE